MAYDSAVVSFTTKTDKVDLVQAAHMNSVQSELVTIETILGTNVKGNRADLKTRLANALDTDGSLLSGTAFPSPALSSQGFWRTDLGAWYIHNITTGTWVQQGQSLSNVVFCWNGLDTATTNVHGYYTGTSTTPDMTSYTAAYSFLGVSGSTYETILVGKFIKIAGISTVTINARIWSSSTGAGNEAILNVDVGGQSNTVKSVESSTPTWVTASTIDVSSLTNGTTYDITIQLKQEGATSAYCSAVVLIGS